MSVYSHNSISAVKRAKLEMLYTVAKTIGLKNPYTEVHSEHMVDIAILIARRLDLNSKVITVIKYGALLHDIGKIAVPNAILNKPAKLTKEEFDIVKEHTITGYELLKDVFMPISLVIRDHHERVNGLGYPYGAKGDKIDIGAKIVAIADVYDALISERPYKQAFSKDNAIDIIKEGIGSQFDPICGKCFLEVING